MTTKELKLTGLTCEHCVSAVKQEVGALNGVTAVEVALKPGEESTVTITADPMPSDQQLTYAIEEAGYSIVN